MNKKTKAIAKTFTIFAALAGIIYVIHAAGLDTMFDRAWVDDNIRDQGVWGYTLFLLVAGGLTAVGMPRQFVSFLAGYAFGAAMGTVWGTIGTTLGCAFVFGWARLMGRGYVLRRHGKRIERLNNFISHNPFSMTLVIRCLPVGNNLLTNLAAGVSNIPASSFIGGSCLGYIPQTLIFALLGSGVRVDPLWRTTISALLFVISSALGWMLYRRYRVEKTLDEPENAPAE
ncbi:TVP38/TMEM64 family protein [Oleidesulfovibrio sp.]|uniref:TVP38/TMEM64 family protein n=1 Tax=Oleidesulfovibrio sp. TaxID=2909707 RepID=UPI003A89A114